MPPTLDDLPTLQTNATPTGDDLLPVYDLTATGSSKVRKLPLNAVFGLAPTGDVVTSAAGTITVTSKLTLITSGTTSTVNMPLPSGVIRDIIVMNGGSGTATATSATANIRTSPAPTAATTAAISTGTTARFLSDGTIWYRTH
jgi:hypothetical protein